MKKITIMLSVFLSFSLVIVGVASAEYMVDQHQDLGGGFLNMGYAAPLGQEFVPDVSNLAAVELFISISGGYSSGPEVSVNIRENLITGTIVGTGYAASSVNGWNMFELDDDAWLTVGDRYVMEFISSSPNGITKQRNNYDAGRYIFKGTPNTSGYDLQFRTYYDDAAAVPVPAAVWLIGSAFLCMMGIRRKK